MPVANSPQTTGAILSMWTRLCCLLSPVFFFSNCVFLPCLHRVSSPNRPPTKNGRRMLWFVAFTASSLGLLAGLIAFRALRSVLNHEKTCVYTQRSSCGRCLEVLVSEDGNSRAVGGASSVVASSIADGGMSATERFLHSHDHDSHEDGGWAPGSAEACVAGKPPPRHRRGHHGDQENLLQPCHTALLAGDASTEQTCPFYGKHGEDLFSNATSHGHHHGRWGPEHTEDAAEHIEEDGWFHHQTDVDAAADTSPEQGGAKELFFHCRRGQDCQEVCNCLGGTIEERFSMAVKMFTLAAAAALFLGTFLLLLPRLYWHDRALRNALDGSSGTDHLSPSGVGDLPNRGTNWGSGVTGTADYRANVNDQQSNQNNHQGAVSHLNDFHQHGAVIVLPDVDLNTMALGVVPQTGKVVAQMPYRVADAEAPVVVRE